MTGLPGVIETVRFIRPGSKGYQGFIDYMDREEAIRNEHFNEYSAFSPTNYDDSSTAIEKNKDQEFKKFNDYMGNPYKTEALFSAYSDQLNLSDRQQMKNYFTQAQEAKSPLWQVVYSFDNKWLVDHGMLNPTTNELDTKKVYAAARKSIGKLEQKSGLMGQWTGAVHYNTDNIHVHIGYVEREPTREWIHYHDKNKPALSGWQFKGSLKKREIKASKATFVNHLLDLEPQLNKSETLMKQTIQAANLNKEALLSSEYKQLVTQLIQKLPDNRNQWVYGYAEKNGFKSELDKLSNLYLNQQTPKQLYALKQTLQPISQEYERAYGNPNHKATYGQNKLYGKDGLYYKFGNSILKTLKETVPERQQHTTQNISETEFQRLKAGHTFPKNTRESELSLDLAAQSIEQYFKGQSSQRPKKEQSLQMVIDRPKLNNEQQGVKKNISRTQTTQKSQAKVSDNVPNKLPTLTQTLNQVSDKTVSPGKRTHKSTSQQFREVQQDKDKQSKNNQQLYSMRRIVSMLTGNLGAIQAEITSQERQKNNERQHI